MTTRFFLDTNIVLYCFDDTSVRKQSIARDLLILGASTDTGVVGYQVIQEFLNVALNARRLALANGVALAFVERFLQPISKTVPGFDLFVSTAEIQTETKYSFYDCLIVAAALQGKCEILYSEDMQHDHRIGSLRIVNPFLVAVNESN